MLWRGVCKPCPRACELIAYQTADIGQQSGVVPPGA